jgi:ribonuclease H2 subunit A
MTFYSDIVCQWPRVKFPDSCRDVEIVIGVDEAGRGPVLGSMVYGIAFWPISKQDEICAMGFNDSKQLTEATRDALFKKMLAHPDIGWVVEEITAETLSHEMLRIQPVSLNSLSYDAVVRALETIRDGYVTKDTSPACATKVPIIGDIFVDTVGDPEYYKSRLQRSLGQDFGRFTIEKKADATYKVVSGASIVAKVTRDTLMKDWECRTKLPTNQTPIGNDYGSGYPGDPACVQWLLKYMDREKLFLYPADIVRFSWGTVKELCKTQQCKEVIFACDDEDNEGAAANTVALTSYFGRAGEKRPKRCGYYTKKKFKHVLPSEI